MTALSGTSRTRAYARVLLLLAIAGCWLALGAPAHAEGPQSAWWRMTSSTWPTQPSPGEQASVIVDAYNLGDAGILATGSPVTLTDNLPEGLTATAVAGYAGANTPRQSLDGEVTCQMTPTISCTWAGPGPLQPLEQLEMVITVSVSATVHGNNAASVSGGQVNVCQPDLNAGRFRTPSCDRKPEGTGESEAHDGPYEATPGANVAPASVERPVTPGASVPFGAAEYDLEPETAQGTIDAQAGSHPFQLTTTLLFDVAANPIQTPAILRTARIVLPPGLVGDAAHQPKCTAAQFASFTPNLANECPTDTAIGITNTAIAFQPGIGSLESEKPPYPFVSPVFNLVPERGEPARFGFEVEGIPVVIDTRVRTGQDYAVEAIVSDQSEAGVIVSSVLSFWGDPGDQRHDGARGWDCAAAHHWEEEPLCAPTSESTRPPFLELPTSCTGELQTSDSLLAWDGQSAESALFHEPLPSLDGCESIPFSANITVNPGSRDTSTATGLSVDVHVPTEASEDPEGLAESDLKNTTVTLPPGLTLNPSAANGLQACSEQQAGYEPEDSTPPSDLHFTDGPATCPEASKLATAQITVPVLAHPLEGGVYLAEQERNPFGSLVAVYLIAEDPESGVLVKLAGDISLNQETGQVTATFENAPQAPVEDIQLHFFGGDEAALSTSSRCGSETTQASFTPWSGEEAVLADSTFLITAGPGGDACPSTLPFGPALAAGSANTQAAAFAAFNVAMAREDGQQPLKAIQITAPPGLTGVLAGVPLCSNAAADAGTCSSESLLGESTATVGVGPTPFTVPNGKVYLTEAYDGAPFGLSIVTPAVAGPFNLGLVIVRARVEVNKFDGQITATTDQSGPFAIPTILKGIPVQLRRLSVTINRPDFILNPSDCNSLSVASAAFSSEGAASNSAVPYQVANCAKLKFTPKFAASTTGHASRADGVSFTTKIAYPASALGTQANISYVKVVLPKQLPSRDSTLKKACLASVFESNPAACPSGAVVGHATVRTPLLPVPLTGPAYFVSHGGAAFPSLTLVLSGYGITVELVGDTLIQKGITSTTFKAVPDLPFSNFELVLPSGADSALGAYGTGSNSNDLCSESLKASTHLVAQNGAEITQDTPIELEGCDARLSILHHSIAGRTLKLTLNAPTAGTVLASGHGLTTSRHTAKHSGTFTMTLKAPRTGGLRTSVNVTFMPQGAKPHKEKRTLKVVFAK